VSSRAIIAIVALVGVSVSGLISNVLFFQIVAKVNERLSQGQQFRLRWWYWPKYQRLKREYKRLYPDGSDLRNVRAIFVLMCVCLLICAWGMGFFRR
jgi:hypothetical protein